RVRATLGSSYLHAVLCEYFASFLYFLKSIGIKTVPSKLVLFAHLTPSLTAFASKGGAGGLASLTRDWWKHSRPYDCVVAHVCRGADVLSQASYAEVFPNWVSYRDDIRKYLGSTVA